MIISEVLLVELKLEVNVKFGVALVEVIEDELVVEVNVCITLVVAAESGLEVEVVVGFVEEAESSIIVAVELFIIWYEVFVTAVVRLAKSWIFVDGMSVVVDVGKSEVVVMIVFSSVVVMVDAVIE
jgi:hypothetical protein